MGEEREGRERGRWERGRWVRRERGGNVREERRGKRGGREWRSVKDGAEVLWREEKRRHQREKRRGREGRRGDETLHPPYST